MEREEMLRILGEQGGEAGSDYNDAEDVDGWFGWDVSGDELTVWHRATDDDGHARPKVSQRWKLVEAS